ncbi:MAG: hypothetical protein DHS20C06_03060 [Hyphobacterium sp.]|nr:MAG: hypothetical protein DHS20C06_03060 [Hyphobacterium sp.]
MFWAECKELDTKLISPNSKYAGQNQPKGFSRIVIGPWLRIREREQFLAKRTICSDMLRDDRHE